MDPWKTDRWWVGSLNYDRKALEGLRLPTSVSTNETTLRDGLGQVGISVTEEEAKEIAVRLDELGVQQIEACYLPRWETYFPSSRRNPLKGIVNLKLKAPIWTFCDLGKATVDLAAEAGVSGAYIEVYGMKYKIQALYGFKDDQMAIEAALKNLEYARRCGLRTSLFLAEATRSDIEFLERMITEVAKAKNADRITICDTMGCGTPHAISYLVKKTIEWSRLPVEVHCHNDLGLATANSLAAALSGAEMIHTTLLGIGERAGNASLEEVALSLLVGYGLDLCIRYEKLFEISNYFQKIMRFGVFPFKPVIGKDVFLRESVLGAESLAKFPRPTIYEPSLVGQKHRVAIGEKSSEFSIRYKLKELGESTTDSETGEILERAIKSACNKKGNLTDDEFIQIVRSVKK